MPEIKQKSFLAGIINDPRSNNPQGFFYGENVEVGNQKSIKQIVNNQAENSCAYNDGNRHQFVGIGAER